ncbi:MAG: hypothetical protein J6Y92_02400 [Lentisphaeria bacterium]|nr:hypothetical protein [Lentisphaeria bacterium]
MTRSVSTALALTLGLAVSAAVVFTVFAQRNHAVSASGPAPDAPSASEVVFTQAQPSAEEKTSLQAPAPPKVQPQDKSDEWTDSGDDGGIRSGSLSITATPKTNPETVKVEKLPEIEVDSSNVRSIPKASVQPIRESKREIRLTSTLPGGSLAEKLTDAEAETVQTWRPAFASQGFRGARLDAFAVSQDGSVLAIAERTGTYNGPNGTRIVLVNTSNWQFIRVFTVGRMLKKLAFVPGGTALAAIAFPQAALKQEFGLAVLDLAEEKEQGFLPLSFPFNTKIEPEDIALLAMEERIICSGFFGSTVFCIHLPVAKEEDSGAQFPFHTFETVSPASALAITPDGKSLAAASLKAIEYFDLNSSAKYRRKSITSLDLGWKPVAIHFLNGAQTDFVLCPAYRDDTAPIFVRSAAKDSLDGRSAGFAVPMEQGSRIGVAFKVKGRIDIVDPATLEANDSVILEQLRPETTGDTAFVFYHDAIHAFCVIDTNGNCFAAGKREGEKRWSKRIIWNGGASKR